MRDFAREGWIRTYPAFAFAGGRIFTRLEMSEVTAELARYARAHPAQATPPRLDAIKQLADEFARESERLGADMGLPQPTPEPGPTEEEKPRPVVRTYGSLIGTQKIQRGDGNDLFTQLTDANLEGSFFRLRVSGQIDNDDNRKIDRDIGDVFFGHRYSIDTTERFAEVFGNVFDDAFGRFKAGTLRNVTFARGVMIGAHDSVGFLGEATLGANAQAVAFWGRTDREVEVAGARLAHTFEDPRLRLAAQAANIRADGNVPYGGGEIFYTDRFIDATLDVAFGEGGRHGIFAELIFYYYPNLRFDAVVRRYEDLVLQENSPPIYTGISGADSVDDRGGLFKIQWAPWKFLTLTTKADFSENQDRTDTLKDYFGQVRASPWVGGLFTSGYEYEDEADADRRNRLISASFSQTLKVFSASISATRDDRDRRITDTIRSTLRYVLFDGALTVEFSHTFRDDETRRENIYQPAVLWKVADFLFISARYTYSDDEESKPSLELTGVIQW